MSEKKEDTYRMGKNCGYDLLPDGSIKIAPCYMQEFKYLRIEERAIETMLQTVVVQCTDLRKGVETRKIDLWERMANDYGLDLIKDTYAYTHGGILEKQERKGGKEGGE